MIPDKEGEALWDVLRHKPAAEQEGVQQTDHCGHCGATFDPDYSAAYQDEYQRLWHEAASVRDAAIAALERLQMAARECDSKAEKLGDPIRLYQMPCGPWHRLLALTGTGPVERSEAELWRERAESAEAERGAALARAERAEAELRGAVPDCESPPQTTTDPPSSTTEYRG